MMDLVAKTCVPCEGGTPPMKPDEVKQYLAYLKTGWVALENKKILKEYEFKDFRTSIAFVNRVADVAESEGHHPDIFILFNKVAVELSTHAIGGLSENDFILGAKIDHLALKFIAAAEREKTALPTAETNKRTQVAPPLNIPHTRSSKPPSA